MRNTLLLLLFIIYSFPAYGSWQYKISNYSKKEYKAANQNWQFAQHSNGWMYIANNKGLLEFDGVYWNTYSFRYAKIRAVKEGRDGLIYAGGMEEFGYYTPNDKGKLMYTSLSDSIPGNTKIGVIWEIGVTDDGVYFISNNAIFRWYNQELSVVCSNKNISSSAAIDNKIYVVTNEGLMRLDDKNLSLLPNTSQLSHIKVIGILPAVNGILLISSRNGIYLYKDNILSPYEEIANDFIRNNQLFCATIKDNKLAVGSVQNGLMIIDLNTKETKYISIENGLQNKTVLRLFFDQRNNLWVALDNGIDCIHLDSPVYSLSQSGIIGTGYSACFKGNTLYLGTNQGLYHAHTQKLNIENELNIELLPGTQGQVWSLQNINNEVFCNSDNGVFVLKENVATKIDGTWGAWKLAQINSDTATLVKGTYSGLYVLKKENGKWRYSHRIEGFRQSCKTMLAEDMENTLWVANSEYGIHRIKISEDLKKTEQVKNYNNPAFPLQGNACIARVDNDVIFTSVNGLYRYNQIKDSLETYKELEDLLDGKTHYSYLKQDRNRNIWYVANGTLKLVRYNSKEKVYEKNKYESYLSNSLIEDFEDMHFYSDNEVLIGTEEGFSFINFGERREAKYPLFLNIRKVYSTSHQDSLIYGNSFTHSSKKLTLPYSINSLKIEFSASSFDPQQQVVYSSRLQGKSKEEWSDYSKNTTKEFTHLKEGNYVFEVKALTNNYEEPVMTSFQFRIMPPWYRSIYAYVGYTLLLLLFLYAAWRRLRNHQQFLILQQKQEMLEKELEFKRESKLKDEEIDNLKEKSLQDELKYKTAELLNSTLNLTRKNEILIEIKKEAAAMSQAISAGDLISIRRRNLRLINKINNNLEHDEQLESFQTNFDALHHDFFNVLGEQFPNLNKKEKMMCAYIRTNMLTKEMAPLLNMTVRAVEIARYRLRKKMNLNEKDNLYEFLQKITAT